MVRLLPVIALLAFGLSACQSARVSTPTRATFAVDSVATGTTARLIGLDAAENGVVWAAGTNGAWARSLDGGRSWTTGTVPDADTLQFRDVEAFDATRAVLLSIGPGTASRIYATDDGGATWALRWTNPDPSAFFDCMAFDGQIGFAFSDARERDPESVSETQFMPYHLPLVGTRDGGRTWTDLSVMSRGTGLGAGAFASSGTCAVFYNRSFVIAYNQPAYSLLSDSTGNVIGRDTIAAYRRSLVAMLMPEQATWQSFTLPFTAYREMDGVATMATLGDTLYLGLLGSPDSVGVYRVVAEEGGPLPPLPIPRVYGLAASPRALVATGPDGLAASADGGQTWRLLVRADLWSATRVDDRTFVAVGRGGKAVRITVR